MTYVVLGMHKSGTSLVAEILHRAGIPMVEVPSEADYDSGNKWERKSTRDLDKEILAARDASSLSLDPPDPDTLIRDIHLERARSLAEDLSAKGEWGFKDPRACLAWPLWHRVLESPQIIGIYRHYGAVAQHFVRTAPRAQRVGMFWRIGLERLVLRRWCEYNGRILDAIEQSRRPSILLSYERLMRGNEELDHLRRFLGRDLQDPREPEKVRHWDGDGWRTKVGALMARLSGKGSAPAIFARLDAKRADILSA